MEEESVNKKIDEIYKEIGEIGPYQILIVALVSCSAIVLSNADYSYNIFLGATPDFRCKIPTLENDTYEVMNEQHAFLIDKYILPKQGETSIREKYDTCNVKLFPGEDNYLNETFSLGINASNSTNYKLTECSTYVYSKLYYDKTTTSEWNLVCKQTSIKSLFTTLYFVGGLVGILPSGILSDKFGRKTIAYLFIIASSVSYALMSILLNIPSMDRTAQLVLFGILRLVTGLVSTFYPIATVLAMEYVGPSRRVLASNSIYFFFIIGQYFILLFGFLVRQHNFLIICYTGLITIFVFYFWYVPESPRWLLLNNKKEKAILIFERIAKSNKKDLKDCVNLLNLKKSDSTEIELDADFKKNDPKTDSSHSVTLRQYARYFLKTKRIFLRTLAIIFNWTTNNLIYYGVGLNTSDLAGNPFSNFALSISLELIAGIACQFAFTKFGRKLPCMTGMFIAGLSLVITGFIPSSIPILITVLALIAKFAIAFPFNGMMIITSELHPTVIRNSMVSFCTTISQLGSIVAPQFYLLGELYFYPIPFIIFGVFALVSAVLIFVLIPETKDKVLPDTIDDYIY